MKKNKLSKVIWFLLLCLPSLVSCGLKPIEEQVPIPERNPVTTSAAAKTIRVKVKNLNAISPENQDTDKVSFGVKENNDTWKKIENGWITIFYELSSSKQQEVEITVAENRTGETRQYVLKLGYRGKFTALTIKQYAD